MKRKSDIILWVSAIALLLAIVGYTVYSISFFSQAIDSALSGDADGERPIVRFDFEKADQALKGKIVK